MIKVKKLLKPPFSANHGYIFDDEKKIAVLDIAYSTIGDFFAAALNEKWERDFSEPLRWIRCQTNISPLHNLHCPKCKTIKITVTPYCPHCGQKLSDPENETFLYFDIV
jgi:hypothetical protein